MAVTSPPPDFFSKNARWLPFGALLVALAGLWIGPVAVVAFLAAAVVLVAVDGRLRRMLSALALVLALGGLGRFLVHGAARDVVESGQHDSEEQAVSRLREILWAERQAKSLGLVKNANGEGEYLFLGELTGADRTRRGSNDAPILAPDVYAPASEPGTYRAGGYEFVVTLPAQGGGPSHTDKAVDATASAQRFCALAMPLDPRAGTRIFSIDDAARICEAPRAFATKAEPTFDDQPCHTGADGVPWTTWGRHAIEPPRGR